MTKSGCARVSGTEPHCPTPQQFDIARRVGEVTASSNRRFATGQPSCTPTFNSRSDHRGSDGGLLDPQHTRRVVPAALETIAVVEHLSQTNTQLVNLIAERQ